MIVKKLGRRCKDCGKRFIPNSKFNFYCDECKIIRGKKRIAKYKENLYGKTKRIMVSD